MPHCGPCDRYFKNSKAVQSHITYSSQHIYCSRCSRYFRSVSAREQHYAHSSSHWRCRRDYCNLDFLNWDDLREHRVSMHDWCDECSDYFECEDDLREHRIGQHNMCHICDRLFNTPANLQAHLGSHRPRNVECYGCERRFKSLSAMVLHLEYGGQCDSESDLEFVE